MKAFGLRFSNGYTLVVAVLAAPCILLVLGTRYAWAGPALVAVGTVVATVTFRGRRLTGWVATACAWLVRRRKPLDSPSEPVVGTTVQPGDHVAVRWQGEFLVAVIELVPRPFTPTVIVDGRAQSDDVVDTRLLEELLLVHCPDLQADVVSAGYRVGSTAPAGVVSLYGHLIGADPAPAHRRTWIMLRAHPRQTRKSARRRAAGPAGLVRYLVASTTRIADALASSGVDAVCGRSFDDVDRATEIDFERERWSMIKGHNSFTAAYTVAGGPDVWWSTPADRTITRFRVTPGQPPRSTVMLTTATKPRRPQGFCRLPGAQRAALQGETLQPDRHCQLPIGSAGLLVGETARRNRVYMPFDDIDASVTLGDATMFTQFVVRTAAAGGIVTLTPRFEEFATLIGADTGPEAKVAWPNATTLLDGHPGVDRVTLRHDAISTPRHRRLAIQAVSSTDESRYLMALPEAGSTDS